MTAIAGLVRFDGDPVDGGLAARMIEPLYPGVHDAKKTIDRGSAALACCGRGAGLDRLCVDAAADCTIVLDGRIDNRREIARWLEIDPQNQSDARLLLAGYTSRGTSVFERLSGDFALAIWDGRARRLVLARDPLGVRQICFARAGEGLAFATDPRQLLEVEEVDRRPNMGFFAEWIAGFITHDSDTIYRGIQRVPAAHVITVSAAGIRGERYWDIDPERRLRYRDPVEYALHFRELFASSVQSRLRSADRVAVALSGGIDSSAILAMAAAGDADKLRAYNVSYPGLPEADEHHYAALVTAAHNIALTTIRSEGKNPEDYRRAPRMLRDTAPGGVGATDLPFYETMAADGCGLVLDGAGGDEWFAGTPYYAADLIRGGRWLAALETLQAHASHTGSIHGLVAVAKGPLWATLPPTLRRAIKRMLPARDLVPRLFRRDFAASVHLVERITEPNYDDRFSTFAAGAVYREGTNRVAAYNWHEDVRLAAAFGMEMSAPFQDRALAEFAVALPEEQRWFAGRTKRIVRDALKDLVPADVLRRDDKGNGSEAQFAELQRLYRARAFDDMELAAIGVIDAAEVEPMFASMCDMFARKDLHYEINASQLWLLFCAESMWRVLFGKDAGHQEEGRTWSQIAIHQRSTISPDTMAMA